MALARLVMSVQAHGSRDPEVYSSLELCSLTHGGTLARPYATVQLSYFAISTPLVAPVLQAQSQLLIDIRIINTKVTMRTYQEPS